MPTACLIPAKKSCSSHFFGVVPSRAAQTAYVPELSKGVTFCLRSYPCEISHSNSPNRELSNDLAGPALFRGRLRAFGKCTDVVASSKGRLNLDSVRLILRSLPLVLCLFFFWYH